MIYLFIYRRRSVEKNFRDDLSARKSAEFEGDVSRVETPSGRVVWRRAETPTIPGWLNRKK